jgi:ribosomal protein S24E
MTITPELLQQIEELAGLFMEPDEIAVLLDLDIAWFANEIARRKSEVFLAYFKGKTISKKELHENVVKLAKRGSPQAEELVTSFITKQTVAEKRAKR